MTSEGEHLIFRTDPAELIQYVYKEVCVTVEDESQHVGWVYTVDPVTHNIILAEFKDDGYHLEIVMGHTVKSITVINGNTDLHKTQLDRLFRPEENSNISPEELKAKQEKLRLWLCKNRIPVVVTENDCLSISGALTIEPPYGPDNCLSTNEIILGRIQGLIKNMPVDVEDW